MFLINYETNNQIDYNKYVGRYFERITPDQDRIVFRIDSFDGKYFRVTKYLLTLGFSTKTVNQGMYTTFLERSNFKEITEAEFELIKYLCIEPFVTIYDNNSNPIYCREYINKRMQDTMNEININGKRITAPDGCSVSMIGGKVYIDGKEVDDISKIESKVVQIEINGNVKKLKTDKSVTVKGNAGNIDCGGSCNVFGDVNGDIDASGSVRCKNVSGDINARGSVRCERI